MTVFAVYLDKRRLVTYTVLAFILSGVMWNFGGDYVTKLATLPAREAIKQSRGLSNWRKQ